jgi:hypothetical protein
LREGGGFGINFFNTSPFSLPKEARNCGSGYHMLEVRQLSAMKSYGLLIDVLFCVLVQAKSFVSVLRP